MVVRKKSRIQRSRADRNTSRIGSTTMEPQSLGQPQEPLLWQLRWLAQQPLSIRPVDNGDTSGAIIDGAFPECTGCKGLKP
mmetsp:Transcript_468/g.1544  ORF Transcript_468/g.1544 Transcript_468/m.1544 type:complete len:81 (+) Transcript_468:896-1138(+)